MSDEPIDERYVFRLFLWQKCRMDKDEYDTLPQSRKDELIEMFNRYDKLNSKDKLFLRDF